jgi:steroid delta-isomerase-like uncharacterized protein
MSIEENKALVQRFYDALGRADYEEMLKLFHKDFVFYSQVDTPHPGGTEFIASERKSFEAFNGFKFPLVRMVAEGDQVAAYLVFEGRQSSDWQGIPARGAKLKFSLFALLRISDGKIIEKRAHYNVSDIVRQLTTQT